MRPPKQTPPNRRTAPAPAEQLDARALARSHREALRRRTRRIRRSVGGLAVALFTAAFIGIYVQLASGHDPALTAAAKRQAAATSTLTSTGTSTTAASKTSSESASSDSSATGGESTGGESSNGKSEAGSSTESASSETGSSASAVTTSQS